MGEATLFRKQTQDRLELVATGFIVMLVTAGAGAWLGVCYRIFIIISGIDE